MRKLYTEYDLRHLACVSSVANPSAVADAQVTDDARLAVAATALSSVSGPSRLPANGPTRPGVASPPTPAGARRRRSSAVIDGFQTDYGTWSRDGGDDGGGRTTSLAAVESQLVEVGIERPTSSWRRALRYVGRRLGVDKLQWPPADTGSVADAIDRYSRLAFPFTFLILSSVYWTVYLQIRPTVERDPNFVTVEDD
jgi:hypothetical protein